MLCSVVLPPSLPPYLSLDHVLLLYYIILTSHYISTSLQPDPHHAFRSPSGGSPFTYVTSLHLHIKRRTSTHSPFFPLPVCAHLQPHARIFQESGLTLFNLNSPTLTFLHLPHPPPPPAGEPRWVTPYLTCHFSIFFFDVFFLVCRTQHKGDPPTLTTV